MSAMTGGASFVISMLLLLLFWNVFIGSGWIGGPGSSIRHAGGISAMTTRL
jgi:hypothetical protein